MKSENYLEVIKKVKVLGQITEYYFILGERFLFLMLGAKSANTFMDKFITDGRVVYNCMKPLNPLYEGENACSRFRFGNNEIGQQLKIEDYVVDASELLLELFPKDVKIEYFKDKNIKINPFENDNKNNFRNKEKINTLPTAYFFRNYGDSPRARITSIKVNYKNDVKTYLVYYADGKSHNPSRPLDD